MSERNEPLVLASHERQLLQQRLDAIPELLVWHGKMIKSLEADAEQLVRSGYTHQLGMFLKGIARAHRQVREWAEEVLAEPCPTQAEDESAWLTYTICLRLLRRHAAAWSYREDYRDAWRPSSGLRDPDGPDGLTTEELALGQGLLDWSEL